MRRLATAAAAALAAAVVIVADGAASASPARHTWIICDDGQTSTGLLAVDGARPGGILEVSGHVDPCGLPARMDAYTVAAYYPHHAAAVREEGSGGTTEWAATYPDDDRTRFGASVQIDPDAQAICLVTGAQTRAHCYEVTTPASGTGATAAPTVGATIPNTDARVQHTVPRPLLDASRPPSCGSCW